MSLRIFHMVFILLAIVGADLFGLWAVWNYVRFGDSAILAMGIVCLLGGLGLIAYLIKTVRMFDQLHE